MLNVKSFEREIERRGKMSYSELKDLTSDCSIEERFNEIVSNTMIDNYEKEEDIPFHDTASKELMKEIDTAEYTGTWDIETRIGSTTITALSTGCKLGLLLIYYTTKVAYDFIILTKFTRAGDNVWRTLNCMKEDVTFCISDFELSYECCVGYPIKYEGSVYEDIENQNDVVMCCSAH